MTRFLQIHTLTSYPAANLNRDDSGRPKTMVFGGAERLRVSSQSMKRAWRTSPEFRAAVGEANIGARTQEFGYALYEALTNKGLSEKDAAEKVRSVIEHDKLGKLEAKQKTKKGGDVSADENAPVETNQLVHLGQDELDRLLALADRLYSDEKIEASQALILQKHPRAVDIAMFGRMLADNTGYNVEGAVEVAHAFTTHRVTVEDDFYTAVDDLKALRPGADAGAGFMGDFQFGAGVFYQYANVNLDLLVKNLAGDDALARKAVEGLIEAMTVANPKGKQHATAARARTGYLRVESGDKAPRTLANAFLRPVRPDNDAGDLVSLSVEALKAEAEALDRAFGDCVMETREMEVRVAGSLSDCIAFASSQVK
jgi:CRISPR system Cascade subunit CasC